MGGEWFGPWLFDGSVLNRFRDYLAAFPTLCIQVSYKSQILLALIAWSKLACCYARFGTAASSKRHPLSPATAPYTAHPCVHHDRCQLPLKVSHLPDSVPMLRRANAAIDFFIF